MNQKARAHHVFKEGDQALVLLAGAVPRAFTYKVPAGVSTGAFVEAPLGPTRAFGVVEGPSTEKIPAQKIKSISNVLEIPATSSRFIDFIHWVADYCMATPGNVLSIAFGGQSIKPLKRKKEITHAPFQLKPAKPTLSPAQKKAADTLVAQQGFTVTLLDGVTGSGKTEVYCEALEAAMERGQQALLLLPEIALTAQITDRLKTRFGFHPTLWHSELTPAKRREAWKDITSGRARLIIGARSALFLPYPGLGVVVVDEEHDASYKQEEGVIYQARDMAVARAMIEKIPVILASATPSVETWVNAQKGKYNYVHLPERHNEATLPNIHLVDIRQENMPRGGWISPTLLAAMQKNLADKKQTLLFLNRRGYAPLTLCRKCGHRFSCPNCSSWLVEHRASGKSKLICHQCDYAINMPDKCPACSGENTFAACGPGVERLLEEVTRLFPNARSAVLTSDTQGKLDDMQQLVKKMERGDIDILIGTQLVAKGYHFPGLTLVGVIDGDLGLQGGDLRAAERTFQMLTQVSGRSGREDVQGNVYIQTTQPQHPVMVNLARHDRNALLQTLSTERAEYHMPPFARLATITVSGEKPAQVEEAMEALAKLIPSHEHIRVLGPAPAPMAVLRGRHRMRFLLKARRDDRMQIHVVAVPWGACPA